MGEKKGKGRPTKYKAEYCEQAKKLCAKGFIDTDLADFFDVNVDTIYEWKKRHPNFSESLKGGKVYSDEKVVLSLYQRALGIELVDTKIEDDGSANKKVTTTTKQVAGDVGAMCMWLKNRMPSEWRNNPEPTDEDDTGEKVTIKFEVAEPVREVKVTKGE